jgi:ribosomal protein S18 acetylase RimI-like enzyme
MSTHKVRRATSEDAHAVAELGARVREFHARKHPEEFYRPEVEETVDFFRGLIERAGSTLLVAEDESFAIVGYAFATVKNEPASIFKPPRSILDLEQMAVAESVEGKGYGGALLHAVDNLADEMKVDEIRLVVWSFNEHAIGLYEHAGYAPIRVEMTRRR